jgi:integrase/recombinase XerD
MSVKKRKGYEGKEDNYYCYFTYKGIRIAESTESNDKKQAELWEKNKRIEVKEQVEQSSKQTKEQNKTVSIALEEYSKTEWNDAKDDNIISYKRKVNKFINIMGDMVLSAIDNEVMRQYKLALIESDLKVASVNNYISFIMTLLKHNEIYNVRVKRSKVVLTKDFTLTNEQEQALYDKIMEKKNWSKRQELKDICFILMNTGLRINELLSLKSSCIDFKNKIITITEENSKTKMYKELPVSDNVMDVLKNYKNCFTFKYTMFWDYFNIIRNSFYTDPNLFKDRIINDGKWILKNSELHPECKGFPEDRNKFTIHSFRHTFATRLIDACVPINKVSKLLGHSNIQTTQRYCNDLVKNDHHLVNLL